MKILARPTTALFLLARSKNSKFKTRKKMSQEKQHFFLFLTFSYVKRDNRILSQMPTQCAFANAKHINIFIGALVRSKLCIIHHCILFRMHCSVITYR